MVESRKRPRFNITLSESVLKEVKERFGGDASTVIDMQLRCLLDCLRVIDESQKKMVD